MPDWYEGVYEMDKLLETDATLFKESCELAQRVQDSSLVMLCDEESLKMYETLFQIIPQPNDSLDTRRERVLYRLQLKRPFNIHYLKKRIEEVIPVGSYKITVNVQQYSFNLEYVTGFTSKWIPEVNKLVLVILPANLIYTVTINFEDSFIITEQPKMQMHSVEYFKAGINKCGDQLERYYDYREEDVE